MERSAAGRSPTVAAVAWLACVVVVLVAAGGSSSSPSAPVIMPLGDSITDGFGIPGGYRIDLEDDLLGSGLTPNFVGSLQNGPTQLADKQHEGHSGWRIDEIHASVAGWLLPRSRSTSCS